MSDKNLNFFIPLFFTQYKSQTNIYLNLNHTIFICKLATTWL